MSLRGGTTKQPRRCAFKLTSRQTTLFAMQGDEIAALVPRSQ